MEKDYILRTHIHSKHDHSFGCNSTALIYNRSTQLQSIISLVALCSFQTKFSDSQNVWVTIFHMALQIVSHESYKGT